MEDPLLPQLREAVYASGVQIPNKWKSEVITILRLSIPISVSELLSFGSTVISTAYIGALGSDALSSWTLAHTLFHVSGLAIVVGLASGQPTFSGQAYGAGQYTVVGLHMQRVGFLCLLVAAVIVVGWWWGAEVLMHALGQPPSLIAPAAMCLRIIAPALFLRTIQVTIKNYFTSQGVVMPQTLVCAKLVLVTPAVNQLMIHKLNYGLQGAAFAYNVLTIIEVGMLLFCVLAHHFYVKQTDPERVTWGGWSSATFVTSAWSPYLRIALPSCAMVCLNWWCYEAMVIIAGLQSDAQTQLGAMGVLFSTHSLAFMVASGMGVAVATRMSNELGACQPKRAKHAMHIAGALAGSTSVCLACVLVVFREQWAHLYAQNPQVVDMVIMCMPLLALSVVFDSVNVVLSGVLRGCGYQMIGFLTNLGTFFVLGIPLAAFLDLPWGMNLGVYGIWVGLTIVASLQAGVLTIVAACFDYKKLVAFSRCLLTGERQGVCVVDVEWDSDGSALDDGSSTGGSQPSFIVV